jgi:pimeloyl-ACP methyl ester carboxylesterase
MLPKLIQTLFKITFKTVELIAPPLASRWAVHLFFRPVRFNRPAREKPLLEKADIQQIPFAGFYRRSSLASYYTTYTWGHGPAVLLVHGWAGRGSQMGFFVQPLVEAGYQVVTFDAPAHGDSPGKRTNILEFVQIIQDIERDVGGFVAIVGHSLGGIAAALAMQRGVKAQKLVTIGSPATMEFILNSFAGQINASPRSLRRLRDHLQRLAESDLDDFSLNRIAPQLKTPGLIIHDQGDRNVHYSQAQTLAQSWPEARLITTDGLGHNRILRNRELISTVVDFIASDPSERSSGLEHKTSELKSVPVG